jgi:hypothetical protein
MRAWSVRWGCTLVFGAYVLCMTLYWGARLLERARPAEPTLRESGRIVASAASNTSSPALAPHATASARKTFVIFVASDPLHLVRYARNLASLRCYVAAHSDYALEVHSTQDSPLVRGCAAAGVEFLRHCMLANLLRTRADIAMALAIDADCAVLGTHVRFEDFADSRSDFVFEIRFHNGEVSAIYIARNTPYAADFLHEWGAMKWRMNSDNGALHQLILQRAGLGAACARHTDYYTFLKCFNRHIEDSQCASDFLRHRALVRQPPHTMTYDGWVTQYRYTADTFIHHAMKNPPIGGKYNGRVLPDLTGGRCKLPANDTYRMETRAGAAVLLAAYTQRQDNRDKVSGFRNTSCLVARAALHRAPV